MSRQASQIRRNSVYSLLSSAIRLIANFLMFVGIARFYGAQLFGQFTTAHTLAIIFTLFADFGFDTLLATEIAKNKENVARSIRQYLSLKFLFCLLATVSMAFFPFVQSFSLETKLLIYIFCFYVFISAVNNFFFALFKGYEQLHHETRISFIINLFLLLLLIFLGLMKVSIIYIAVSFVSSRILGLILVLKLLPKVIPEYNFQLDYTEWRDIVPKIAVFGIHYLFGNLFFQLDTLLLAFWKSDYDVGIYQSVFKLIGLALVFPDVIINALMPTLSRFHGEQKERWVMLGELMNKTLFLVSVPLLVIFFVYADQIIYYIYGNDTFSDAVPILRIFAVTVFVRYSAETYALMLTTSNRQKSRMIIVVLATIVNLLLNAYFIREYGVLGAALVSLVTNILVGLGYVLATENYFVKWVFTLRNIIPLCFGICVGLILWNIKSISVFYAAPFIALSFGAVAYYIGFTAKERKMVFPLLNISK